MQNVALDTNAYTALNYGNTDIAYLIKQASKIGLPITVIGEIYYGIFDGTKQEQNSTSLHRILAMNRIEILHVTTDTARLFGEIFTELKRIGRIIQQNDIWIAALCKQYGYRLITNDTGFQNIIGLETISF